MAQGHCLNVRTCLNFFKPIKLSNMSTCLKPVKLLNLLTYLDLLNLIISQSFWTRTWGTIDIKPSRISNIRAPMPDQLKNMAFSFIFGSDLQRLCWLCMDFYFIPASCWPFIIYVQISLIKTYNIWPLRQSETHFWLLSTLIMLVKHN